MDGRAVIMGGERYVDRLTILTQTTWAFVSIYAIRPLHDLHRTSYYGRGGSWRPSSRGDVLHDVGNPLVDHCEAIKTYIAMHVRKYLVLPPL